MAKPMPAVLLLLRIALFVTTLPAAAQDSVVRAAAIPHTYALLIGSNPGNLMVGLRGAGDRNHNGVVSLAEAYGYAYGRTLAETARTAVGQQHTSLETALTGQGEVPITFPAESGAQLELPAGLEADVLLEREGVALAKLHKVQGSAIGRPAARELGCGAAPTRLAA